MSAPFEGGCTCTDVRYRCTAEPFVAYTCHCQVCQHVTSSAFATCMQVPAEALSVIHGAARDATRVADSGNRLTTSFCPSCGSALFVANSVRPRIRTIYVGTLDQASDIDVRAHIYASRKLPWVLLPQGHRSFPEAGDWRADYAADPSRLDP